MPPANLAAAAAGALCLLAASPTGALWVTTLPSGADVWVDGTYVGRAPVVVDALSAGEHRLTLTLTGWTPQDLTAAVQPAQTATAAVVLSRGPGRPGGAGTLVLLGSRSGSVSLDGEPLALGREGTVTVPAGSHELAFASSQGRTSRTVTIYPQMRTEVVFSDEAPPRSAVIAPLDEYVPAAAVRIDGSQVAVRYGGHEVTGRLGSSEYRVDRRDVSYDAAPTLINGRLYLPLDLLTLLNPTPLPKK